MFIKAGTLWAACCRRLPGLSERKIAGSDNAAVSSEGSLQRRLNLAHGGCRFLPASVLGSFCGEDIPRRPVAALRFSWFITREVQLSLLTFFFFFF